jgi:hypothetical protein
MPVVIFLSDGKAEVSDECIYDICHAASRRGFVHYQCYFPTTANDTNSRKPLSVHTVSFGQSTQSILPSIFSSGFLASRPITRPSSLTRMVEIAQEVEKTVPQNVATVNIPSSFTNVLDTVRESNGLQLIPGI